MSSHITALNNLISKLRWKQNPRTLVSELTHQLGENQLQINLLLTDLIFTCCKIPASMPAELVENNDIDGIRIFIDNLDKSKKLNLKTRSSYVDYWSNVLKFFEVFWYENWNYVYNNDQFNSYINKLIAMLCTVEIFSLRLLSVQLELKLITSFLKNKPECYNQQLNLVRERASSFLKRTIYDKHRQIWLCCLRELSEWFFLEPVFQIDTFFRFVIWSLKDQSVNVVLFAIRVSSEVLNKCSPGLLKNFVPQVVDAFLVVVTSVGSPVVFERICECCLQLYTNFENAISAEVVQVLESHLFTLDRKKSKIAAKFWLAVNLEENSPVPCFRTIVKFLCGRKSIFVELFVDSLIDHCSLITDWKTVAQVLAGNLEDPLTDEEKELLLLVIAFAIQQLVTENSPFVRMRASGRTPKNKRNEHVSKEITKVFLPYLESILLMKCQNYAILLKMISFFDFSIMSVEKQKNLIATCSLTFQRIFSFTIRKCTLELLSQIELSNDESIRQLCRETINGLITNYEKKYVYALEDLLVSPQKYQNSKDQQSVSSILIALHILSSSYSVCSRNIFNASVIFLKSDLPTPWNPTFVETREISVILTTRYIVRKIDSVTSLSAEDKKELLNDVMVLIYWLTAQLNTYYHGRLGEVVFFSLCELAKSLSHLRAYQQYKNYLFPKVAMDKIAVYLTVVLRGKDRMSSSYDVSSDCVRMYALLEEYLQMIKLDLFPLTYAYDVLRKYCEYTCETFIEKSLIMFLKTISSTRTCQMVADWLFVLIVSLFESVETETDWKNILKYITRISELLYAVKKENWEALCLVHKMGIDYAISNAKRIRFFSVLINFQLCLDKHGRQNVYSYLMEKPACDATIMKEYANVLRKTRGEKSVFRNSLSSPDRKSSEYLSSTTSSSLKDNSTAINDGLASQKSYREHVRDRSPLEVAERFTDSHLCFGNLSSPSSANISGQQYNEEPFNIYRPSSTIIEGEMNDVWSESYYCPSASSIEGESRKIHFLSESD